MTGNKASPSFDKNTTDGKKIQSDKTARKVQTKQKAVHGKDIGKIINKMNQHLRHGTENRKSKTVQFAVATEAVDQITQSEYRKEPVMVKIDKLITLFD